MKQPSKVQLHHLGELTNGARKITHADGPSEIDQIFNHEFLKTLREELLLQWDSDGWDDESKISYTQVICEAMEHWQTFMRIGKKTLDAIFEYIVDQDPRTEADKIFVYKQVKEFLDEEGAAPRTVAVAQSDIVNDVILVPAFINAAQKAVAKLRACQ